MSEPSLRSWRRALAVVRSGGVASAGVRSEVVPGGAGGEHVPDAGRDRVPGRDVRSHPSRCAAVARALPTEEKGSGEGADRGRSPSAGHIPSAGHEIVGCETVAMSALSRAASPGS